MFIKYSLISQLKLLEISELKIQVAVICKDS